MIGGIIMMVVVTGTLVTMLITTAALTRNQNGHLSASITTMRMVVMRRTGQGSANWIGQTRRLTVSYLVNSTGYGLPDPAKAPQKPRSAKQSAKIHVLLQFLLSLHCVATIRDRP